MFDGSKDLKLNATIAFTNGSVKIFDNIDITSLTTENDLFSFRIIDEKHKKLICYTFLLRSINYYELTYTEKE